MKNINPSFLVTPVNDISGNMKEFLWAYEGLAKMSFQVISTDGPKTVELIRCKKGEWEDILNEIDQRGYISAPSPYVLGLGIQYKHESVLLHSVDSVTSIDEKNALMEDGRLCFLCVGGIGPMGTSMLGLAAFIEQLGEDYWFAVIRK